MLENSCSPIKKQQGLALLVLVVVIALAFITYTVSELSIAKVKVEQIKNTRLALKKAKQALIAYAVNYPKNHVPRGPGYFLCPDTDNDGDGETSCNGPSTVGRLPWRTLNTGDIRDSSNERLWYAVSENFDYTAFPFTGALPRKIINTATRGNITVRDSNAVIYDGTTIDGVVAVIIAPGATLTRDDNVAQNRSSANVNNPVHYLDISISGEDNADFDQGILGGVNNNGFIQGEILDTAGHIIVNDIIEVITYRDLMGEVHKRVSKEISNLVNDYLTACGAYPEASVFDPAKLGLFDSAGQVASTSTIGAELRNGHLPLGLSLPVNWGDICTPVFIIPSRSAPIPTTWLAAEEWQKVSYYDFAYTNPEFPSPSAPPLALGIACTVGIDCLTVDTVNNISALIMFAGRELAIQDRVNTPLSVADYYEVENSNLDDDYDTAESEDYIKVITP